MRDARYALLKSTFARAQAAIADGYPIEAIALLESLLTDRLSSIVSGSLGQDVPLGKTLGQVAQMAVANKLVERQTSASARAALPDDFLAFVQSDVQRWCRSRNTAVHAMANVIPDDERPFAMRYHEGLLVALDGVRLLLALDGFDRRERTRNGAELPASAPDAFQVSSRIADLLKHGPLEAC